MYVPNWFLFVPSICGLNRDLPSDNKTDYKPDNKRGNNRNKQDSPTTIFKSTYQN